MIRRAFFAFNALCTIGLVGLLALRAGPAIETAFSPVRVHNLNLTPTRSADRFCWTWSSDKPRLAFSDNVDVFLDVLDASKRVTKTYVPPLLRQDTGLPWQSGGTLGIGHHDLPYCIDLPRTIRADDRIRVRFTPLFHGWQDLWVLPIETPDMTDPP